MARRNIASVGGAVDPAISGSAPILDIAAPDIGTSLNQAENPGPLPGEQPAPTDVFLSKAFWPWQDLGAQSVPEEWLYMSRRVIGVIAQLAVQTSAGPKLVKANPDGTITTAVSLNGSQWSGQSQPAVGTKASLLLRNFFPPDQIILRDIIIGAVNTTVNALSASVEVFNNTTNELKWRIPVAVPAGNNAGIVIPLTGVNFTVGTNTGDDVLITFDTALAGVVESLSASWDFG